MSEIIYLVEVAAYTGSSAEVLRFCTGTGYTTGPADTPANTFYEPRVEHPGLFRQDMFSPGATYGGSSGGYGEIVLVNTDGGLDGFVDYGFDGRPCIVKQGVAGADYSTFATVITGTVEQAEVSWSRVTLRLKDRSVELDVPIQSTFYTGANVLPDGIEGTSELKDKPKPRLFGKCNNVTPVLVNTSKLIWQVSDSALQSIAGVYDNGVLLTQAAGYTDQADMEANAPLAGQYRVWLAGGCFRLGSSPAGAITADAIQGAAAANRTAGQIIKGLVVEKLGAGQVVEQSIIDLDTAAPYTVGFYTGDSSVDVSTALDAMCASVGAWWGFDNSGLFWSKQLTPPDASQALLNLTEAEILSLERTATADSDKGVPIYKVNLDFSKNWTVQTSGLAGSIADNQLTFESDEGTQLTVDRRNLLGMEYIRTVAEDATVQTKHLLAPEITVQTTIDTLTDANTEAARLLALRKVRRDRLNVQVPMDNTKYPADGFWDSEAISETALSWFGLSRDDDYVYKTGGQSFASDKGSVSAIRLSLSNMTEPWEPMADMPLSRKYHGSAVHNGFLYVVGGAVGSVGAPSGGATTASVIRLDLSNPSGSWDDVGVTDLPVALWGPSVTVYGDYLYVFGGSTTYPLAKSYRLDLSNPTGAWEDAGVTDMSITKALADCTMYGSIVILGGGYSKHPFTDTFVASSQITCLDLANPSGSWFSIAGISGNVSSSTFYCLSVVGDYLYMAGGGTTAARFDMTNISGAWDDTGVANIPAIKRGCRGFEYQGSFYLVGSDELIFAPSTYRYRRNDNPADNPQLTSLGRTVNVTYPRYGYDAGRPMKIIGVESDHQSRLINLELWG